MNSEDASGGTLYDRSGYENHGSINVSERIVPGIVEDSFEFQSDGSVQVPNAPEHNFSSEPFSVAVWACNINESQNNSAGIVGNSNYRGGGYMIMTQGNDIQVSVNGDGSSSEPTLSGNGFPEGEWIHVAISHDGSSFTGYLNGTAEVTRTQNITQNSTDFNIGLGPQGGWGASSVKVSDVRIYNRAISQSEINSLYNQRSTPTIRVGGEFSSEVTASGGNEYIKAPNGKEYRVHEFTSNGTFSVDSGGEIEALIVAGGGGGGGSGGGGGGAGGLVFAKEQITSGSYSVTVGFGGSGGVSETSASGEGGNSSFLSYTATGGGGGGTRGIDNGHDGGSGGGGNKQGFNSPGAGVSGQGHDGGFGDNYSSNGVAGGGGGAGEQGQDEQRGYAGDGGIGRYFGDGFSNDFGDNGFFAGGGGGSAERAVNGTDPSAGDVVEVGKGAKGGGGDAGGDGSGIDGEAATDGTGGGGGGGLQSSGNGGDGGDGIVLIRYKR